MNKTETAKQYRVTYGDDMPTLKLARIMYRENNLLFKDVEDARGRLRYIEGKYGKQPSGKTQYPKSPDRPRNPYNLPASDETDYTPYKITGCKRVGILSDIHVPYHNVESLSVAIGELKRLKIDGLLLNGDTIDCHKLSRYVKDPKKRDFATELSIFKQLFEVLQNQLKCRIFFKIGNHEERYQNFLLEKAKELVGVEEFDFENILKARASGIEVIGGKRVVKLNELNGIHGHEYIGGISAPVNVARGLYLRGKVSAFQGHNHSTSEHTESDMDGKLTTTWSIGCLSELHPEYMPLNKWNHGFAWVELDNNGKDYQFHNKRIYKGKVL